MPARITRIAFEGAEARRVEAELVLTGGQVAFQVVDLDDKAVTESKERVHGVFAGMGLSLPGGKRIVANLSPADLPKEGPHFDLPIALALLTVRGVISDDALEGYVCVGKLLLDGSIAPICGALPAAVAANGFGMGLICPHDNGAEAAWAGDMPILAPRSLIALINHLKDHAVLERPIAGEMRAPAKPMDLNEVKGQEVPKRALAVAAAEGHGGLGKCACGKAPRCLSEYQNAVSGPLMDRIDLQVDAPAVSAMDIALPAPAAGTKEVAASVLAARTLQIERAQRLELSGSNGLNATASGASLEAICVRTTRPRPC